MTWLIRLVGLVGLVGVLGLPVLSGCPVAPDDDDDSGGDDDDSGGDDDESGEDDDDSVDDDDSGGDDDDSADDDDSTEPGLVDCAALPEKPLSSMEMTGPRGYHGLVFDEGILIGGDEVSLLRSDYTGGREVWVPNFGVAEGMDRLPGGDFVVSAGYDGPLVRIAPDGGQTILDADLHAYAVVVDDRGMVWTGGSLGVGLYYVTRTDPDTGETSVISELPMPQGVPGGHPRGMNFNRDHSVLYVATASGYDTGTIFEILLDKDGNAVGEPSVFVDGVGDGWLDAIGIDACGNLYVPDSWTTSLYKVTPDGVVSLYVGWAEEDGIYGHAAVFGTGIGGWRTDALYMPMPYSGNKVLELVIGVPGRDYDGEILNAP